METWGPEWLALSMPIGLLLGGWAGLSGYSGWPLLVPMLYVVLRLPLFECLCLSLCVDWVNAAAASLVYVLRADAQTRAALRWAACSAPLVAAGAFASFALLPRFGALLQGGAGPLGILIGAALIVRAARLGAAHGEAALAAGASGLQLPVAEEGIASGVPDAAAPTRGRILAFRVGLAITATLVGLIGMGSGFTVAILSILLRGAGPRAGVGTGLVFAALVLPVAILVYLSHLDFQLALGPAALPFAACGALGALLAAWQAGRLPTRRMGIVMGACVLLAGAAATAQYVVIQR